MGSIQLKFDLPELETTFESEKLANGSKNKISESDRLVHDWYRFVLSYPPHIVRDYIAKFNLDESKLVLDPFCGTGTTLVECKLNNISSIGIEANPFAHFVSETKVDWTVDPSQLKKDARNIADLVHDYLLDKGINDKKPYDGNRHYTELSDLDPEAKKLLISNSISPLPLHKSLVLLAEINNYRKVPHYNHLLLAFANALVLHSITSFTDLNLHFNSMTSFTLTHG